MQPHSYTHTCQLWEAVGQNTAFLLDGKQQKRKTTKKHVVASCHHRVRIFADISDKHCPYGHALRRQQHPPLSRIPQGLWMHCYVLKVHGCGKACTQEPYASRLAPPSVIPGRVYRAQPEMPCSVSADRLCGGTSRRHSPTTPIPRPAYPTSDSCSPKRYDARRATDRGCESMITLPKPAEVL